MKEWHKHKQRKVRNKQNPPSTFIHLFFCGFGPENVTSKLWQRQQILAPRKELKNVCEEILPCRVFLSLLLLGLQYVAIYVMMRSKKRVYFKSNFVFIRWIFKNHLNIGKKLNFFETNKHQISSHMRVERIFF